MEFFSKIGSRIGADGIKYDLNLVIHYIKAKLKTGVHLKVVVKRGADKKDETQPMLYDATQSKVIFEYPLTFFITMYKKGEKFGKKDLSFRMEEIVIGKKSLKNGKAIVDFTDLANSNTQMNRKEVPLKGCSDKKAVICISISLIEAKDGRSLSMYADEKPMPDRKLRERNPTFAHSSTSDLPERNKHRNVTYVSKGMSASFAVTESVDEEDIDHDASTYGYISNESPYRTASISDQNGTVEDFETKGQLTEDYYEPPEDRSQIKKFTYGAAPITDKSISYEHKNETIEKFAYSSEPSTESIKDFNDMIDDILKEPDEITDNPKISEENVKVYNGENEKLPVIPPESPRSSMLKQLESFKENIINPKDSQVESEDSSSDEDVLEISQDALVKLNLPPLSISQSVANENSKEKHLYAVENTHGLVESRRSVCAKCILF